MHHNLRFVYITTSSEEEANKLGRVLVEERLAACVNILPGMRSMYRWKGELVEEQECVLIAKTHHSKMRDLTTRVNELHSYEVPCVVSLTLTENEGNPEYLQWLLGESRDGG